MRLPSFIVGFLALAALEVVTSSAGAAGRAAMIPGSIAGTVRRLLDPDIALIPNWHGTYDGAPPVASSAAAAAAPAQPDPHLAQLLTPPTAPAPKAKTTTPPGSLGWLFTQPTG